MTSSSSSSSSSTKKRARMSRLSRAAVAVLAAIVGLAVCAPLFETALGVSHTAIDLGGRYADAGFPHLFGQNELGQDLFTRLLFGARVSLAVGVLAAVVATVAGVATGLAAAFFGGFVDAVLMRFTDAMLAIPVLPLLLIAAALDVGRGADGASAVVRIVILLGMFSWMTVARLTRAQAAQALSLDHVRAARALGASELRVVAVHVLPLCLPPVIVQATLEVGGNILAESALSFLGLGVQPPVASWGNMLMSALDVLKTDPPSALLPGCCILLTVLCVQLAGDGVRDLLDPKARR